jgi:hypothetical protein
MWIVYLCGAMVCGLWLFSGFWGDVWQEIEEYERMKSRGYKLLKNDKGEYLWVGYDD